jgi:ketosteroid isomerase-like protein
LGAVTQAATPPKTASGFSQIGENMAFTGPIEEQLAIRDLYACYGDASTRADTEDWLACWTEDGQWRSHIFQRSGKDQVREQWDLLWANFEKVGFLGEVGAIEVDGDKAVCRSVAREIIRLKSGGVYKLVGRYDDLVVRQNGKWLFARRVYQPLVEELPG